MTISYTTPTINNRLQEVLNSIGPVGAMRLLTSTNQTVGLISLANPAGTINGGVLTFTTPVSAPLTFISGQIVAADIEDGSTNVVAYGLTVGNSTLYDIVMTATTVSSGQIVTMTFGTITGK
jgi:hypothetical protein